MQLVGKTILDGLLERFCVENSIARRRRSDCGGGRLGGERAYFHSNSADNLRLCGAFRPGRRRLRFATQCIERDCVSKHKSC